MEPKPIENIRHSLAHILAMAVKKLYPETKLGIGPAIDNGFYYDFDFGAGEKPSTDDLPKIETLMKEIIDQQINFTDLELKANIAIDKFADEPYKMELLKDLTDRGEQILAYESGDFLDLCAGPHVNNSNEINTGAFTLSRVAGAYWKGDEKNKMLTRIYGLAFETSGELEQYQKQMLEAEKRDHKKLGRELDLFIFSDLVGSGLPLYTPRGALVRQEIINYSNELQKSIGYELVHTPNMNKADLFRVSGHYEKYREDMFRVVSNYTEEEYYLKPMNCPQHTQIYAAKKRSYRDLPIRLADFSNLYRDEKPGQLSGLTRLRAFCQDDGHCFCREDQIKEEFLAILNQIRQALDTYKMKYTVRLSLWDPITPEKYLGDQDTWEQAQNILEDLLKENKIEHERGIGEAAIYGPKMDLMAHDSLGRKWQISTIQLDFIMPARFGLTYTDHNGEEKTPVMIHRALIGSPERFMGILIEHYAGAFPVWLAPVQVTILPISEAHQEYAKHILADLQAFNIRAEVNGDNETLGKRLRLAKTQKIPYIIIVGEKEMAEKRITLECRDTGQSLWMSSAEFLARIGEEMKSRS